MAEATGVDYVRPIARQHDIPLFQNKTRQGLVTPLFYSCEQCGEQVWQAECFKRICGKCGACARARDGKLVEIIGEDPEVTRWRAEERKREEPRGAS